MIKIETNKIDLKVQKNNTPECAQSLIKYLHTPSTTRPKGFDTITPLDLQQVLGEVCKELAREENPADALAKLTELLPLEKIQDAIRTAYPSHTNALQAAKEMAESAKYFFEKTQEKPSSSVTAKFGAMVDAFVVLLENLITAIGITDIFTAAESSLHADFKVQKFLMVMTLYGTLFTACATILGPALGGLIFLGIFLIVAIASLIFPHIRPAPTELNKAENWTKLYRQGNLLATDGRKEVLDDIAKTLSSSKAVKTHPLLIGKSGVGKTETIKALVKAIEQGKYPELSGKQVFYFNTADLICDSSTFIDRSRILSEINQKIGRHRENYIFVFDEIHLACQKREGALVSEQLKTLLDPGCGGFPYAIGITTEEDYYRDIYRDHSAFARRFKPIRVENTTQEETLEILNNTLLKQPFPVILEAGTLPYLVDQMKVAFPPAPAEPSTSLKILSKAIQKTVDSSKTASEKKVENIRKRLAILRSTHAVGQGASMLPYSTKEAEQLEAELVPLQDAIRQEKQEMAKLSQLKDKLASVKTATFKTVLKTAKLQQNMLTQSRKKELSHFLLLSHYLAPALQAEIKQESTRLGVSSILDNILVDTVIQEEKLANQKAQEAIELGKEQLNFRTR